MHKSQHETHKQATRNKAEEDEEHVA